MTAKKLDIFETLKRIDLGDIDWFDSLDEEEVKAFQPFVVLQWMYGVDNAWQTALLSEYANGTIHSISAKHKKLCFQLLCACSLTKNNQTQRYQWVKSKKKEKRSKILVDLVSGYSKCEEKDVLLHLYTKAEFLEMAEDMGLQKDEITKLRAELRTSGIK
jgi:hypothetical protein